MKFPFIHTVFKVLSIILVLFALATLSVSSSWAASNQEGLFPDRSKIEPALIDKLTSESQVDFIVLFSEQADLSSAYSMDWQARGEFVYNTLVATAQRSQANAQAYLDRQGYTHQTYIASNTMYIWGGNLVAADSLAALPEVVYIRATRVYTLDPTASQPFSLSDYTWAGDLVANGVIYSVPLPQEIEPLATVAWGITDTKADQFWSTFGVKGDGIVVANIDTGVQWNHPALVNQFKCTGNPSDPNCWKDPANICGAGGACDNNGHGTHTMGSMLAADNPSLQYIAGMAPNARWIACKGCESNSCSDASLNACGDWILAPGGNTNKRPNIVNNSWGGPGGDSGYLNTVNSWRAAGIFPAFSAGNSGPNCGSLGSPGDFQESFASAAHSSNRTIANFSSRGPSTYGHTPYTKPNLSAPGVNICSTVPTNGWDCSYSGTSMASPHTAGAVALLWSCNPSLVGQIDQTFQLLQNSVDAPPAGNCSVPPDGQGNYTYGYGYLNVLKAGQQACGAATQGYLSGHVTDKNSGNPVQGATVNAVLGFAEGVVIDQSNLQAITDPTGYYTMTLVPGTYSVTAVKNSYFSQTITGVNVLTDTITTQNFQLVYQGLWTVGPNLCFDLFRYDAEYFPGTGKVYVLGGRVSSDPDQTTGNIYAFDPLTNGCVDTGARIPTPISNYTVSMVNNGSHDVLCTFGGRKSDGSMTLDVQCYDPATNIAAKKTSLPAAYTGYTPGAQVVVNNKVYVFGGFRSTSNPYTLSRTDRYDPVTNTFTPIGNLNLARSYLMAAVVDGKIYAFGGTTYDGTTLTAVTRTEVMADPGGAGTWNDANVAELPTASGEGRAFGFDANSIYGLAGKVVLTGGGQFPGDTAEVLVYTVANNTYDNTFPLLNVSRRDHAGVLIDTCSGAMLDGLPGMWVMGGFSSVSGYGGDNPPYAPAEFFPLACLTGPSIVVDAPPLDATLNPASSQSININISNTGTADLIWNFVEIPTGVMEAAPQDAVKWVTENPVGGTVSPGGTIVVSISISSGDVLPGVYHANLEIHSNDAAQPVVTLPVTLTVTSNGVIVVPHNSVRFGPHGATITYNLTITNINALIGFFNFSITGANWPTILSDNSSTISIGGSISITITVTVPNSATPGSVDAITFTVTNLINTDQAQLTTMYSGGAVFVPILLR